MIWLRGPIFSFWVKKRVLRTAIWLIREKWKSSSLWWILVIRMRFKKICCIKIVSSSVCSLLKFFHFFLYRCSEKFSHFLHVLSGVIQTARTGSVYVTLGVTIERYFAIVHPFKCFKLKKILLPSAILFAIIYNIPKEIS